MDFFSNCKSSLEAKNTFRKLTKAFHPDKGGDPELMHALITQYESFKENPFKNKWSKSNWTQQFDQNETDIREELAKSHRTLYLEREVMYWKNESESLKLKLNFKKIECEEFKKKLEEIQNLSFIDKVKWCFKK